MPDAADGRHELGALDYRIAPFEKGLICKRGDARRGSPRARCMACVGKAMSLRFAIAAVMLGAVARCASPSPGEAPSAAPTAAVPAAAAEPPPAPAPAVPGALRGVIDKPFTGDFNSLVARRVIRAGVPFNRTFYFVDHGTQRGLSYEYLMMYEEALNKKLKTGHLRVHVVLLPMPADMLIPALRAGIVDMVVAQLTITPQRRQLVRFTIPTRRQVNEVVVTGPGAPAVNSLEDLSGRELFVRRSSSYYDSLVTLNGRLEAQGRPPAKIRLAPEHLQDDDVLEMVNAGLVPITVADDYLAQFWARVFTTITIHQNVALRSGGDLAVAVRKDNPLLADELNQFIGGAGLDTATGAILNKKYLQSTKFVKNATSEAERRKFLALIDLFRRYGSQYQFDYLLLAAQGYQESRLDQNAKSAVGAIGVMQLMPETGREQQVGNITKVEPNVHAGVKYMRFIRNTYFEDEPMDQLNKGLFTVAAYNAGPARIRQLRRETAERGLNPNIWFGNVERVASERIGRETVTYVSNIYKYYVAYGVALERMATSS
jgi:membrane-bound lytic murein transglycosylase MltF